MRLRSCSNSEGDCRIGLLLFAILLILYKREHVCLKVSLHAAFRRVLGARLYSTHPDIRTDSCCINLVERLMHPPYPPFPAIEQALSDVVDDMKARGVRVRHTEVVTTSDEWDDSLGIWFFFEDDDELAKCRLDGTTQTIEVLFKDRLELAKDPYSFSMLPTVVFEFDSHENVLRNYQGSYFLRLR